jgi:hypothetical protein
MTPTNLKETYFTYKTLTKIHGEPTLETLALLQRQIYANAEAVPNQKHGTNGYLGLVMTGEEYAKRSTQPFEHPGPVQPFDPPQNATQYMLISLEKQHDKGQNYVKEFRQMQTTILQQIREAIDEEYLMAHLDPMTSNFTCTIPELMHYLFETYAYISPEELEQRRAEVTGFEYTANQPIDLIFQKINMFARLAELAKATATEQQKIGMAQVLLVKSGSFEEELKQWGRKPEAERTWDAFMAYFRTAYREQKQTRPVLRDIQLDANVAQTMEQLHHTIAQMQQEQENETMHSLLKTMVEQNKAQMEEIKKLLGQKGTPATTKPKKKCERCIKHGMGFKMYKSHWTKDCRNYPAEPGEEEKKDNE